MCAGQDAASEPALQRLKLALETAALDELQQDEASIVG